MTFGKTKKGHKMFYAFDERTDYEKECKKIGLIKTNGTGDDILWTFNDHSYQQLKPWEYYSLFTISLFTITLMQLPEPSFEELFDTALCSRHYSEQASALGVILAKHEKLLVRMLSTYTNPDKNFKKLIRKILSLFGRVDELKDEFPELLSVCRNYR